MTGLSSKIQSGNSQAEETRGAELGGGGWWAGSRFAKLLRPQGSPPSSTSQDRLRPGGHPDPGNQPSLRPAVMSLDRQKRAPSRRAGTLGRRPCVRTAGRGRLRLTLGARSADAKFPGHGVSCAQLLITQAAFPESLSHHPGNVPQRTGCWTCRSRWGSRLTGVSFVFLNIYFLFIFFYFFFQRLFIFATERDRA